MVNLEIDKKTKEKIQTIIYYETDGKQDELNILKHKIDDILKTKRDVLNIDIKDVDGGYTIFIEYTNGFRKIFCFTLSEIFIHLRYV